MPSSLIRDNNIVISASLAATIGLEEATMLAGLGECLLHRQSQLENGFRWLNLPKEDVLALFPFWNEQDIDRISRNLQEQGIILLDNPTLMMTEQLRFALNENPARREQAAPSPVSPPPVRVRTSGGANRIDDGWQPSEELLGKLAQYHGIPADFALKLVPEFVLYWQDRQSATFSWEARFMRHALQHWQQRSPASTPTSEKAAMHNEWTPSEDAWTILVRSGINPDFINDAVPEFVLYWRERGDITSTWNSKFIAHIRRQWARFEATSQLDTEPRLIPGDWQPAADVFDILRLANIDQQFARELVAEFVLYWRDANQAYSSWNTRFLQHVKKQWARQHHLQQQANSHGQRPQSTTQPDRRGFVEKHSDKSWRDGL